MIIGYVGNMGDGKTYNAIYDILRLRKLKGCNVYSNTPLKIPHDTLTIEYLENIVEQGIKPKENSIFFIDEIHIWLDSRTSVSKRNRILSYFLSQTRKLSSDYDTGLILMFTTQYVHQIDKRLRSFLDILIESEKISYKGIKMFHLTVHNFKGKKSFTYTMLRQCLSRIYSQYDSKAIIKVVKDNLEGGED
jgi:hypothetical protein